MIFLFHLAHISIFNVFACRFLEEHENRAMVIKSPFVTNSQYYKSYSNGDSASVMSSIKAAHFKMHNTSPVESFIMPYVMLQERVVGLDQTKPTTPPEPKLIFLNRKFSHFATKYLSLAPYSSNDLIAFASSTLDFLANNHPEFILDGLVRVDLFKSNKGDLVVNELESLEAGYAGTDEAANAKTLSFLELYWEQKIYDCIVSLFS